MHRTSNQVCRRGRPAKGLLSLLLSCPVVSQDLGKVVNPLSHASESLNIKM